MFGGAHFRQDCLTTTYKRFGHIASFCQTIIASRADNLQFIVKRRRGKEIQTTFLDKTLRRRASDLNRNLAVSFQRSSEKKLSAEKRRKKFPLDRKTISIKQTDQCHFATFHKVV
eukprot:GHVP01016850.1.p1 GENE.GHVP01016850.1~~GHVP01016850.1.p1  ORF type:complete len:115 (+),score=12.17 GHVP01016850.1:836-1180(+)